MTWKQVNWVLQWGPTPAGRVDRVIRSAVPGWTLTFHFNPGVPLWVVVKGQIFLRQVCPTGLAGSTRVARWTTLGRWKTTVQPSRWCDQSGVTPAGVVGTLTGLVGVYRSENYDLTRWATPVRGTRRVSWSTAVDGEDHLLRPRYV